MDFFIGSLVTYKDKVGVIEEIYDDVYLVTFVDQEFILNPNDYGYFLAEELQVDLRLVVTIAMRKR
jgi:hypothetical protein